VRRIGIACEVEEGRQVRTSRAEARRAEREAVNMMAVVCREDRQVKGVDKLLSLS